MQFDEQFLRNAIADVIVLHNHFPQDLTVSVDSRTIQAGDLFFALEGAHHDGHNYLADVLKKGAAGIFVSAQKKELLKHLDAAHLKNKLVALVPDTLSALISLAALWRQQFSYPVVGLTGSVGKTSTKKIISNILDEQGAPYLASHGNQNTSLGVSLNILKMRPHHTVALFELGISKRGEMAQLVSILRPTTAIITSIGHSHMEGLGFLDDIALEKRDIFKYFKDDNIGIINGDSPLLADVAYRHPVMKFGLKTANHIQARKVHITQDSMSFILKIYKEKYNIVLHHVHEGMVQNSLAAVSIAYLLKVPVAKILAGLIRPVDVDGRYKAKELAKTKGVIIDDCYNASPESMKAALLAFERLDTKARKIAVLGDMLELGVNSPFWHRQLGRFLRKVPSLNHVILVGDLVKWTRKTLPVNVTVELVPSWQEAIVSLEASLNDESVVLVKGSRGMRLESVVKHFSQK